MEERAAATPDSPELPSSSASSWTQGLTKVGLYYSGFVEDIDRVLECHHKDTVTFYGTRNSVSNPQGKENIESSEVSILLF